MAHVKLRENPGNTIRVVYLVDAAVGRGGPNHRDDVLLVQFFLNSLWGKLTTPGRKDTYGMTGRQPAIDGICGHDTIAAIESFQKWYWDEPAPGGFIDGRVEPVPPGTLFGPHHGKVYTIIGLNVNFGFQFSVDRHFMLCKEPSFPAELKQKLFI